MARMDRAGPKRRGARASGKGTSEASRHARAVSLDKLVENLETGYPGVLDAQTYLTGELHRAWGLPYAVQHPRVVRGCLELELSIDEPYVALAAGADVSVTLEYGPLVYRVPGPLSVSEAGRVEIRVDRAASADLSCGLIPSMVHAEFAVDREQCQEIRRQQTELLLQPRIMAWAYAAAGMLAPPGSEAELRQMWSELLRWYDCNDDTDASVLPMLTVTATRAVADVCRLAMAWAAAKQRGQDPLEAVQAVSAGIANGGELASRLAEALEKAMDRPGPQGPR